MEFGVTMDGLELRAAKSDDLTFVRQCAVAAYAPYIDRIGRKPAPMVADFAGSLTKGHLEILEYREVPVGFLVSYPQPNHLFIENVAIHPDHQGQGLAGLLFQHLERRALTLSLAALELYTNEKMRENIGLYTHLGFAETQRVIEHGFRRVYFRKQLDP